MMALSENSWNSDINFAVVQRILSLLVLVLSSMLCLQAVVQDSAEKIYVRDTALPSVQF